MIILAATRERSTKSEGYRCLVAARPSVPRAVSSVRYLERHELPEEIWYRRHRNGSAKYRLRTNDAVAEPPTPIELLKSKRWPATNHPHRHIDVAS